MNQHISWSEHIQHLRLKVWKLIGILYRQFYTWADTLTLRTVYLTCIPPHLESMGSICNKKNIEALKSVQKIACKVCLKLWDTSYDDMLHLLNLPPLHARRRYLKLVTMFNIINGHLYFPQGIFISQQPIYNSRRTSQFDFCRPRTRTDYYQTSYVPSVISAWNKLPVVVKSPCTVSSFKDQLLYYCISLLLL